MSSRPTKVYRKADRGPRPTVGRMALLPPSPPPPGGALPTAASPGPRTPTTPLPTPPRTLPSTPAAGRRRPGAPDAEYWNYRIEPRRFYVPGAEEPLPLRALVRFRRHPVRARDGTFELASKLRVYVVAVSAEGSFDPQAVIDDAEHTDAHPGCAKVAYLEARVRRGVELRIDWLWNNYSNRSTYPPHDPRQAAETRGIGRVLIRAALHALGRHEFLGPDSDVYLESVREAVDYYRETHGMEVDPSGVARYADTVPMVGKVRDLDDAASGVVALDDGGVDEREMRTGVLFESDRSGPWTDVQR